MKKIASILIITIAILFNFYQNICASSLTRSVTISLLTQDDGNELYAYFGHTAIRVKMIHLVLIKFTITAPRF